MVFRLCCPDRIGHGGATSAVGRDACGFCEDGHSWPAGRFGCCVGKAACPGYNALLVGWTAGFEHASVPSAPVAPRALQPLQPPSRQPGPPAYIPGYPQQFQCLGSQVGRISRCLLLLLFSLSPFRMQQLRPRIKGRRRRRMRGRPVHKGCTLRRRLLFLLKALLLLHLGVWEWLLPPRLCYSKILLFIIWVLRWSLRLHLLRLANVGNVQLTLMLPRIAKFSITALCVIPPRTPLSDALPSSSLNPRLFWVDQLVRSRSA
jgi:hypothetical protein